MDAVLLNKINEVDEKRLSDKAETASLISSVSASPKATFATLANLQADATANTVDGKKSIYLVTADGKWYYWNGTAWSTGGTYQATGLSDNSLGLRKTDFAYKTGNFLSDEAWFWNQGTYNDPTNTSNITSIPIYVAPDTNYIFRRNGATFGATMYYQIFNASNVQLGTSVYIDNQTGTIINVPIATYPTFSYIRLRIGKAGITPVSLGSSTPQLQLEIGVVATSYRKYHELLSPNQVTTDKVNDKAITFAKMDDTAPDLIIKNSVKSQRTLYKHFRSAEMCIPFMYQGVTQAVKTPRFNAMNVCDWNEEPEVFEEAVNWNMSDKGVALDCIVVAGDFLYAQGALTLASFETKVTDNVFGRIDAENTIPVFFCNGNHDLGEDGGVILDLTKTANLPTPAQRKALLYDQMYDRLDATTKDNFSMPVGDAIMYYYVDFPSKNTRMVVLDDFEYPLTVDGNGYRYYTGAAIYDGEGEEVAGYNTYYTNAQLSWLIASLASTPDNYNMLIVNHVGVMENSTSFVPSDAFGRGLGNLGQSAVALRAILSAFKAKTSGSITVDAIQGVIGYTLPFDFSARVSSHIALINGHYHYFRLDQTLGFPNIWCIGAYSMTLYPKSVDSVSQASADIISIKTTAHELYCLRYGQTPYIGANHGLDDGGDINGFHFVDAPLSI